MNNKLKYKELRDAQGNVMATYEKKHYNNTEQIFLSEQHIYGSSRLGMRLPNGDKNYELTNHLGNVLAVVSDTKNADGTAKVVSASDYYPFGMQMPARSLQSEGYRYGFGGHEKDDEISGNGNHLAFGDYGYDTRLGRRWNIDPMTYSTAHWSPYRVFYCNPIFFIDPNGLLETYDNKGNLLGDDSTNDGQAYIITDKAEQKHIKQLVKNATKSGTTVSFEGVEMQSAIKLPSQATRSQILNQSIDCDNENSMREYGGVLGLDANGAEVVSWAIPGPISDPTTDHSASINVFKTADNNIYTIENDGFIATFHTHPSKNVTGREHIDEKKRMETGSTATLMGATNGGSFVQPPSKEDIDNARDRSTRIKSINQNYVIGTSSRKVYIYNGNGIMATIPFKVFKNAGTIKK